MSSELKITYENQLLSTLLSSFESKSPTTQAIFREFGYCVVETHLLNCSFENIQNLLYRNQHSSCYIVHAYNPWRGQGAPNRILLHYLYSSVSPQMEKNILTLIKKLTFVFSRPIRTYATTTTTNRSGRFLRSTKLLHIETHISHACFIQLKPNFASYLSIQSAIFKRSMSTMPLLHFML